MKKRKEIRKTPTNQGQIAFLVVIFFLFISVAVILGFGSSSLRNLKNTQDFSKSKQALLASESGVEDAVYRIKNGKTISSNEVFNVGSSTADTTITDLGSGQREVLSTGGQSNLNRKTRTTLQTSTVGATFNYGIQVGSGGLTMGNGASIIGNAYVNGSVSGGSVTGACIAANSAALAADQSNDLPSTPTNNITFGDAAATQDFAQSFQVSVVGPANKVQVYLKKTGAPANITVRIAAGDTAPQTSITTGTLSAASVTGSYSWQEVIFSPVVDLIPGVTYWLVLDASTGNASKNYTIGGNTASSYLNGTGKLGQFGGTWNNTSPSGLDGYFRMYLGGVTGSISSVTVGGVARAHTVSNSTITGALYCKTGSGNNKACNTTQDDPTPEPFAISDGNIAQWKSDAEAGGVINGNLTVNGTTSYGPKRITGNLTVQNGATLIMTGTIWVEGQIIISNNGTIRLSPAYGPNSGVILSDGTVDLSNNALFYGSGNASSYILLLSTSNCPNGAGCAGLPAIKVSNNVGAVLLDAHNGTLQFSNNAAAKEATGSRIELANNSTITYDSGLVNVNFSSGPGGSFQINSWKEVR